MTVHRFPAGNPHSPSGPAAGARGRGGQPARPPAPPAAGVPPSLRRLRHEIGVGAALLERLQAARPGDPFGQLAGFFDAFPIQAATGRRRSVAFKTRDKYFNILRQVLHTLRELNMRIQNLGELSPRQVRAITQLWESRGHSASSLAALNTVLRRFGCWIGKPQLAPPLATLLRDPQAGVRESSVVHPRTWESRGIEPEEVFRAMERACSVAAMQLRLGWAFGLRVEEQLMLRPHEAHRGDRLHITRGTKGGRPREIEIQQQWELDLIERAKALAARHPKNILARGTGRDLEQARSHYYYLCRKIGLRCGGRFPGTPHGARHSFAARRYQRSGGVAAPVLGGAMPPARVDRAARQCVAEELGHSRIAITSAYIGSVPKLHAVERRRQALLAERELLLAGDPQLQALAARAALSSFSLAGAAATGDRLAGPALVLCEAEQPVPDGVLRQLLARTGELLHCACIPTDRTAVRVGALPTFELPALAHAARPAPPPLLRGQLTLDLDWPTAEQPGPPRRSTAARRKRPD